MKTRHHELAYGKTLGTLTIENANKACLIQHKNHPEWGTKPFHYNSEKLNGGRYASSFGSGSNSAVLFESEFQFWDIVSFK